MKHKISAFAIFLLGCCHLSTCRTECTESLRLERKMLWARGRPCAQPRHEKKLGERMKLLKPPCPTCRLFSESQVVFRTGDFFGDSSPPVSIGTSPSQRAATQFLFHITRNDQFTTKLFVHQIGFCFTSSVFLDSILVFLQGSHNQS